MALLKCTCTAALVLLSLMTLTRAIMIHPKTPPRGFNSFDIQVYRDNGIGPGWNESVYRVIAQAMVDQGLLAKGYDTIVIDGGWSGGDVDEYGRNVPNVKNWPSAANGAGFGPLAKWTHSLGLKMGVWHIRGAQNQSVVRKLPIKGGTKTINQITYGADGPDRWRVCTWAPQFVGIDHTKSEAQLFYNSLVDLYAEWEIDFLKWDCLYDVVAGYSDEETLVAEAVRQSARPFMLSLSPGGGMKNVDAAWIASGQRASFYRATGDFHASTQNGLVEHAFVAANMSQYAGANNTWADLDMMDLGEDSPWHGTPTARLHATIWMMARSPLMFAGKLPASAETLNLISNTQALDIHAHSSKLKAAYQGDCDCKPNPRSSQWACDLVNAATSKPCVAVWWSTMPNTACRALAVLNLGNVSATNVVVALDAATDVDVGGYNVLNVYDQTSKVNSNNMLDVSLAAQGGELFMVTDQTISDTASCIASSAA